jgi:hypothetical protein
VDFDVESPLVENWYLSTGLIAVLGGFSRSNLASTREELVEPRGNAQSGSKDHDSTEHETIEQSS